MTIVLRPKYLHTAFRVGLVFKGTFAVTEIVAGIAAWLVTQQFVLSLVNAMTCAELSEDPNDVVANYLMRGAEHWTASRQHFFALYLFAHGMIKLGLVGGLWRRRLWYYPVAIAVFAMFVAYQLYRFMLTHAPTLLVLTAVDMVVIGLAWFEYGSLRSGSRHT